MFEVIAYIDLYSKHCQTTSLQASLLIKIPQLGPAA